MIIGKFTRTSDGWSGTIQTVTSQTKVRFVPNDKRESERAPDFRVMSGQCELGVAWRRIAQVGVLPFLGQKGDADHREWSLFPFALQRFGVEVSRSNRRLFDDEFRGFGEELGVGS